MAKYSPLIHVSPETMSGVPVFSGTRVPIQTLFDYLKAGESIDDFLEGFPMAQFYDEDGFATLNFKKPFYFTINEHDNGQPPTLIYVIE